MTAVIIPNLNGEKWIGDSIRSVLSGSCKDIEIVVVDNGSTDGSREIIESFAGEKVRGIYLDHNTGFSAAVNLGIKETAGEYVALFNNDAFAKEHWLEELIKVMDSSPKIFSVASLMLQHKDSTLCDDAGDYVNLLGWACKRGDGLPARRYTKQQEIFTACGGAALYRRSILDEIGLFDETFFAYLEDVDIGWRARCAGYKNVLCPTAQCTHICSATTGSKYNDFKSIQGGRNNLLLPYKNLPLFFLIINLPFLVVGYLIKVLFFHIRGYGKPFVQGMNEGFVLLKSTKKYPFKLKNLGCYIKNEWSMFCGLFVYADYRIRRYLGSKK